MDKKLKERLGQGFFIDYDEGERYYDIHIFESPEQGIRLFQRTKVNKEGKIEGASFAEKDDGQTSNLLLKPMTKEEYDKSVQVLAQNFEKQGFAHKYFDLKNCESPEDVMQLLGKGYPGLKFSVKHESEFH